MSECASICTISFLSSHPNFQLPFVPRNEIIFLFWQQSDCLVGVKMFFFSCVLLLQAAGQGPWQVPLWWHQSPAGSSGNAVIPGSAGEGIQARLPLGAPRQPGPRHTRSAASGGTRQPERAHEAERRAPAAKRRVLVLCVPHQTPCIKGSLFSLLLARPHQQEVFRQGRWALHHSGTQSPAPGQGRARFPTCGGREAPGWTGRLCDPPCLEGREQSCRSRPAEQTCPVAPAVPHCHISPASPRPGHAGRATAPPGFSESLPACRLAITLMFCCSPCDLRVNQG